ncbi:MAG: ATP-binding protein [Gammaproteobacteria bacterium]|nr:ATP-binding protein [Gammaproteobacteria bacterium]
MSKVNMETNPFKPGRGRMPPLLAGRDAAQKSFKDVLQHLSGPSPGAPQDIILYGPRGNGKTVLLHWAEKHCASDLNYTVLSITPSHTTSLKQQLMDVLDTPQAQVTTERSGSLGISLLKALVKRSVVQSSQAQSLVSFLREKANENPLVLLVDEAHTMLPGWGHELLNTSQQVCKDAPFMLVLAGTPGLRDCLRDMQATFWARSNKIPLGRLDAAAASDAISTPLHNAGISLEPDVLSQVVTASQCYPYFIQLWGSILWDAAKEAKCNQIDQALLAKTWGAFDYKKGMLYQEYYEELKQKHMVPVALSIAQAFEGREAISDIELHDTVAGEHVGVNPPDSVLETVRELRKLDYIWQGSEKTVWHPGIPSLMTYVQTEAQNLEPDNSSDFSPGM